MGSNADIAFRIAGQGGQASDGLAAVLRARPDDAGVRIKQIVDYFGESVGKQAFEQLSLVRHVEGFDQLVVNLAKQDLDAQGAEAVLRWATTKMAIPDVRRFEFPIEGAVADLLDAGGNLLEFKALNLSGYDQFIAEIELAKIRKQGEIFQRYAASSGTQFTLVFENAVPAEYQALFNKELGSLLSQPNVHFVNGF
jgi:hypothetical protein